MGMGDSARVCIDRRLPFEQVEMSSVRRRNGWTCYASVMVDVPVVKSGRPFVFVYMFGDIWPWSCRSVDAVRVADVVRRFAFVRMDVFR